LANNRDIGIGLILGSGIELNDEIISAKEVIGEDSYGVHNKVAFTCKINGKSVLVFGGRKHFYEGSSYDDITDNVRKAGEYGVKYLIITNAAGGLNENFSEGDLMVISSHLNLNNKMFFPQNSNPYSGELKNLFMKAADELKIKVHEGVYGFLTGPAYETKAEISAQKKMGMDAAGMSTIPEVYEAAKLGINVIAVSVITNLLRENMAIPAFHRDIVLTAKKASVKLNLIIERLVNQLN
jgi:purine-nucleoside phosphorylase